MFFIKNINEAHGDCTHVLHFYFDLGELNNDSCT